jgi:hypothetical protein
MPARTANKTALALRASWVGGRAGRHSLAHPTIRNHGPIGFCAGNKSVVRIHLNHSIVEQAPDRISARRACPLRGYKRPERNALIDRHGCFLQEFTLSCRCSVEVRIHIKRVKPTNRQGCRWRRTLSRPGFKPLINDVPTRELDFHSFVKRGGDEIVLDFLVEKRKHFNGRR